MFLKPYKIKSNNTLKNSEKKQLAQRVQDEFPNASEETCKLLVPSKAAVSWLRLTAHSGAAAAALVVDGVPLLLEVDGRLLPTAPALWRAPSLVPTITIHAPVLSKLQNGAPLYLPGVEIPPQGVGFPMFARGAALAVCTQDNAAAAAVGWAASASVDMILKVTGVVLEPVHIFGDLLCREPKFNKIQRPSLPPPSYSNSPVHAAPSVTTLQPACVVKEEWPSLGRPARAPAPAPAPAAEPEPPRVNEPQVIPDRIEAVEDRLGDDIADMHLDNDEDEMEEDDGFPTDMDALLQYCLLSFIKLDAKKIELPLKTNLLYRNHLVPLCPPNRTLDVKKSSYKKMSKFLDAMQKEGLLEVREIEKGVDAVVALSPSHPLVAAHRPPRRAAPPAPAPATEYRPPRVAEMFCVTAAVLELFQPLKKGTAVSAADVRSTLTEYVKTRSLASPGDRGAVVLDPVLAKICGRNAQETMKWEELMSAVQGKMTACTEMRFADGTVKTNKSKLEPVKMQVATRSGNKKVTLVSNLESFGLSLPELSKVCQHGVAASCGVTRAPGAAADQLMVQGDQTYFIAKLLIEKYGLPKKFVEGADKALKKKNK
ncbi:eukaryotic translation initiation factor 2D [Plutella xylostella]|uniref:eukaryotic translation initiation factor 2D n=1 Tax=Plutella xylostella TaxID=51655 RepID=UPI0020328C5A|nr:eukaryotic translation initiation factor 2D [Plutella xylostella]